MYYAVLYFGASGPTSLSTPPGCAGPAAAVIVASISRAGAVGPVACVFALNFECLTNPRSLAFVYAVTSLLWEAFPIDHHTTCVSGLYASSRFQTPMRLSLRQYLLLLFLGISLSISTAEETPPEAKDDKKISVGR